MEFDERWNKFKTFLQSLIIEGDANQSQLENIFKS